MDNPVFKSCHEDFRIKYHFVFAVKYRKDLFVNDNMVGALIIVSVRYIANA